MAGATGDGTGNAAAGAATGTAALAGFGVAGGTVPVDGAGGGIIAGIGIVGM